MIKLDQLFNSYKAFLKTKSPIHHRNILNLEKNNSESARAEAVVYYLLKSSKIDVENYEDPKIGGPDFICEFFSSCNFICFAH